MSNTFKNTLIQSIREAAVYDSGSLQPPVAILWPDPERQWEAIIDKLQQEMPELLRFAEYDVSKRQGPAIWLKCMVGRTLPEADWDAKLVPVIYLPGIAKSDLRNLSQADPEIAPLMEYQYTGTLWIHRNGKEWTVNAFLQNKEEGLGLDVATDHATKDGEYYMVYNAVNLAELAIEKGAKTLLIPVNARKQLNDLSDEMIAKINVQYYTDLKDCLLKALVE